MYIYAYIHVHIYIYIHIYYIFIHTAIGDAVWFMNSKVVQNLTTMGCKPNLLLRNTFT